MLTEPNSILRVMVVAIACLALAGKVEELPKKIRDLIKMAHSILTDAQFKDFGSDPRMEVVFSGLYTSLRTFKSISWLNEDLRDSGGKLTLSQNEVLAYERVLLKTIKFDFIVKHPYEHLLDYVKKIRGIQNEAKMNQLMQMSWSFINDSLATTLCLQWEPEILACAVLYLATRITKLPIDDWTDRKPGMRWWESFVEGMTTEVLEDICHRLLDLYPPGSIKVPTSSTTTTPAQHTLPSSSTHSRPVNHAHHPTPSNRVARYSSNTTDSSSSTRLPTSRPTTSGRNHHYHHHSSVTTHHQSSSNHGRNSLGYDHSRGTLTKYGSMSGFR